MTYLVLLIGLEMIVLGADWLVDGASAIARKAGVSQFVIGLTIVGFGTSCPELVVSVTGALQGNADIAVGNVVGSNIFNVLFILGLTALVRPVAMSRSNRSFDIPITLAVTILMVIFSLGGEISRIEAGIFLLVFALYVYHSFVSDKGKEVEAEPAGKEQKLFKSIFFVVLGLAGLVFGGDIFVDSATKIATDLGVSDKFIAVTVLAGGTSLPELATCIVAAVKGKDDLALGNILGSNVFNILFILGCSGMILPLSTVSMTTVDLGILVLSVVLLLIWAFTGKKLRLDRWESIFMLLCFAAYYVILFNRL